MCLKNSEEDVASLRKGGFRVRVVIDDSRLGQESVFSRRRSRPSREKAKERGFRRGRSGCPRARTHTCFTSGASSRFFFFCLPLSTRASLGFKMRLTSANFFVLVLFLPIPADPGPRTPTDVHARTRTDRRRLRARRVPEREKSEKRRCRSTCPPAAPGANDAADAWGGGFRERRARVSIGAHFGTVQLCKNDR